MQIAVNLNRWKRCWQPRQCPLHASLQRSLTAGLGVGLLPEVKEMAAFQIVQKLLILWRKCGRSRRRFPCCLSAWDPAGAVPMREGIPKSERQAAER